MLDKYKQYCDKLKALLNITQTLKNVRGNRENEVF